MAQYDSYVKQYDEGSVALSDASTEAKPSKDWGNISGSPDKIIIIDMYRSHRAIHPDAVNKEYIVSTETGETNSKGNSATNVSDLLEPKANLENTTLELNICNSNNPYQYTLNGPMVKHILILKKR